MTEPHLAALFADNKDIYDLLLAEKVFNIRFLRSLSLRRGIVLPRALNREELIAKIALQWFGRRELDELIDMAAPEPSRPPSQVKRFNVNPPVDDIVKSSAGLVTEYAKNGESLKITHSNGLMKIDLTYKKLDTSKTRLRQKLDKLAQIEMEIVDGQLVVRSTPGAKTTALVEEILARLASTLDAPPESTEIDLSGIASPEKRSEFFLGLLRELRKLFKEETVKDVKVFRAPVEESTEDDVAEASKVAKEKINQILKGASLEGEHVLQTPVFKELEKLGFFITRLQWTARRKTSAGLADSEVSCEAYFHSPENASDFRYRILSVREASAEGTLEGAPRQPKADEERDLKRAIENAAEASLVLLEDELTKISVAPVSEIPDAEPK